MDVITYPCRDLSETMLVKGALTDMCKLVGDKNTTTTKRESNRVHISIGYTLNNNQILRIHWELLF